MDLELDARGSIGAGGLTPLLDTLFVLLFSLLAASDVRRESERSDVLLRLPQVEESDGGAEAQAQRVVLVVDRDNAIRLAGEDAVLADGPALDRALTRHLDGSLPEEVAVEIRADRDARYGLGVELLQHLRLHGFVDVLLTAAGGAEANAPFGGEAR